MPAIDGVVRSDGEPLGGAYVRLIGPSDEFVAEIYTREDGVFTFHVVDGTWTLETRAAGAETATRAVEVAGADASVTVEL
ncbi:MAG TPA: DUF1416 domain-containing protein [Actinomycetota bacterium]|jgi:hypothetical protein